MNDVVYSKRIVVSHTVYQLKRILNLPGQFIYNVIILISIATLIFFLQKISQLLVLDLYFSKSMSFFWVYYPFLFCGCTLMAGFDDITQWALSAASIYFFLKSDHLTSAFFFLFALLCRETSIFLLACFFFPYKIKALKAHHLYYIISLIVFIAVIILFGNNQDALLFLSEKRIYTFIENFYPTEAILRTLVSFINVFGIPVICYLLLNRTLRNSDFLKSLKVFILVNTIFSLLFSLVDESRIIGFPMIFFVPYIGCVLTNAKWPSFKFDLVFWLILTASLIFSFFIYKLCDSKSCIIYQGYTFINLMAIYFLYRHFRNTQAEAVSN